MPARSIQFIARLLAATQADWAALHEGRDTAKDSRAAEALFKRIAGEAGHRVASKPRADRTPVAIWYERVGSPDRVMPIVADALPKPNTYFTVLLKKNSPWIEKFASVEGARVYDQDISALSDAWRKIKVGFSFFALLVFVVAAGYLAWSWFTG